MIDEHERCECSPTRRHCWHYGSGENGETSRACCHCLSTGGGREITARAYGRYGPGAAAPTPEPKTPPTIDEAMATIDTVLAEGFAESNRRAGMQRVADDATRKYHEERGF